VGAPICLQEVRKPSHNASQLSAKAEGCVHDKMQKGWRFWVSTWNVDSLTGRAGELIDAVDKEVDVECSQEI